MFELKELEFLYAVLKSTESQDEMTLFLLKKLEKTVDDCKNYDQCLWKFYWDCGRQGEVEGVFKATKKEVEDAIGKDIYFGEILGKHSEVYGTIEEGEITLVSDNPLEVMTATVSGYDPLDFIRED